MSAAALSAIRRVFPKVPLQVEDLTREWVADALHAAGIQAEVLEVRADRFSADGDATEGLSGSTLIRVVAVLGADPGSKSSQDERQELRMVYKATSSSGYGDMDFGTRMMLAFFEPGAHRFLAMQHNLGFREREFYDVFALRQTLSPGLPVPRVFATPSRGCRVDRIRLFTTGFYTLLQQANGILMEDLTAKGFKTYAGHASVEPDVVREAILQLARFHACHWKKSYVRGKDTSIPESFWCGQSLLENTDLCNHLGKRSTAAKGGKGLVAELLKARDEGKVITCNLPQAAARCQLLRPGHARQYLPELFQPLDGPFFSALYALESGTTPVINRLRRLRNRRPETLVMGDAHSGNIFSRGAASVERRRASDGGLYTKKQFQDHFKNLEEWDKAACSASLAAPTEARTSSNVEVRWIDFQHWGAGCVAVEIGYLLMGMVDDPSDDADLLKTYHAEFSRWCPDGLDLAELKADIAAIMLGVAASALLHYPNQGWQLGWGTVPCLVENPQNQSAAAVERKVREVETNYRIVSRCIRRVPHLLGDTSNPLSREVNELHAKNTVAVQGTATPDKPRSRL